MNHCCLVFLVSLCVLPTTLSIYHPRVIFFCITIIFFFSLHGRFLFTHLIYSYTFVLPFMTSHDTFTQVRTPRMNFSNVLTRQHALRLQLYYIGGGYGNRR